MLNLIQALMCRLHKREDGQTIVEYGLVLGGVSLVLIAILVTSGIAGAFTTLVGNIVTELT